MKKAVVIGGGFAGALAAKTLEKYFHVTLIDTKDYFEFTPSILRTIIEPNHIKKIQVLHTQYLKKAEVVCGHVNEVQQNQVILASKKIISFDYLAICSGSTYNLPIKEQDVVRTDRAKHLRDHHNKLEKAETIALIGGGLVGVELAAEISEKYPKKKITLLHAHDHLIPRNHPKASAYATAYLEKKGIQIVYNDRLMKREGKQLITQEGKTFTADLVFLCTGITPSAEFMKKNFPTALNEKGQIKVNEYLQMQHSKHIFVAGDVTDRKEEKTAQNAEKEGAAIAQNIRALDQQHPLKTYSSKKRSMVISLGKWNGIFEHKNFVFTGIIPGLIKTMIEWKTMQRYR